MSFSDPALISAIKAQLTDYSRVLDRAFGRASYRYVGINYADEKVLSCKFYWTYIGFDMGALGKGVPAKIFDRAKAYRDVVSRHHVDSYGVPGCGFTVSMKFDSDALACNGVYFRISCDSSPYVEKFLSVAGLPSAFQSNFDASGVMKYISVDGRGSIVERSYIYCNHPKFLTRYDDESGIVFSASECIEISTDWDHLASGYNMRVIGISRDNIEVSPAASRVGELREYARRFGFLGDYGIKLHGYYIKRREKSVFFFDEAVLGG